MIRLVIAEDQALVLGALATVLALEDDIEIVARAEDGTTALEYVRQLKPDILLSDIEMPGLSGLDVAEAVTRERLQTSVLIVTTFGRAGYLRRAMDAGVRGYLLKDTPSDALAAAVRTIAAGGRAIAPEHVGRETRDGRGRRPPPAFLMQFCYRATPTSSMAGTPRMEGWLETT